MKYEIKAGKGKEVEEWLVAHGNSLADARMSVMFSSADELFAEGVPAEYFEKINDENEAKIADILSDINLSDEGKGAKISALKPEETEEGEIEWYDGDDDDESNHPNFNSPGWYFVPEKATQPNYSQILRDMVNAQVFEADLDSGTPEQYAAIIIPVNLADPDGRANAARERAAMVASLKRGMQYRRDYIIRNEISPFGYDISQTASDKRLSSLTISDCQSSRQQTYYLFHRK